MNDVRGHTLLHVLQVAWRCQVSAIVLECVPEVQSFDAPMATLQQFALAAGVHMHEVILDLGSVWGSNRRRWWCVLHPADASSFFVQAWPTLAESGQSSKKCSWNGLSKKPPCARIRVLGRSQRRFQLQGKAPTALHSYANALGPCVLASAARMGSASPGWSPQD